VISDRLSTFTLPVSPGATCRRRAVTPAGRVTGTLIVAHTFQAPEGVSDSGMSRSPTVRVTVRTWMPLGMPASPPDQFA